jgi:hypothetical protein
MIRGEVRYCVSVKMEDSYAGHKKEVVMGNMLLGFKKKSLKCYWPETFACHCVYILFKYS